MLKRLCSVLVLSAFLFAAGPVLADTVSHAEANVQFFVPDTWSQEQDGATLTISAPDNSMSLIFWVVDVEELEDVGAAIDEALAEIMTEVDHGEVEETQVNGFQAFYVDGTGLLEGHSAEWQAAVLLADKPLVMLALGLEGTFERFDGDLQRLLKSLRRAR